MSLWQHTTMRLTEAPAEIASTTRKVWDALFDTYGFNPFHPIEGRGTLFASFPTLSRRDIYRIMESMIDRGFAIAP